MTNAPSNYQAVMTQITNAGKDFQPEAIEQAIETLLNQNEMSQWIVGDVILLGGGHPDYIEQLAKLTGSSVSTLKGYAHVAETWGADIRWDILADNPRVKYSHMKLLCTIVNDPQYGLARALKAIYDVSVDGITVKALQRYIAVKIRKNKPRPKLKQVAEFEAKIRRQGLSKFVLTIPAKMPVHLDETYQIVIYETESES